MRDDMRMWYGVLPSRDPGSCRLFESAVPLSFAFTQFQGSGMIGASLLTIETRKCGLLPWYCVLNMRTSPKLMNLGGTSSGRLKSIVSYAPFLIWILAAAARSVRGDTCNSEACKLVAEIYDSTVNESLNPCSDFFSHVCSGWLKGLGAKYPPSHTEIHIGSNSAQGQAADLVLVKELNRLSRFEENAKLGDARDSELQAAFFYRSCLRSVNMKDWELNIRTLRRFFYEVDLPFFDEKRTVDIVDGDRPTALSTLLKLALQFGIQPIFAIDFEEDYLLLKKRSIQSSGNISGFSTLIAKQWKHDLLDRTRDTFSDAHIGSILASVLDAYRIRLDSATQLRVGRNYEAVWWMYRNSFNQSTNNYENFPLDANSEILGISYLDLFEKHVGNIAKLKKTAKLKVAPHFFLPLMEVTIDAELTQIFDDFIGLWILRFEFPELSVEASCALGDDQRYCQLRAPSQRAKFCALAVS